MSGFQPFNSANGYTVNIPPIQVIDGNGVATFNGLTVTGISNLGPAANVIITGGANGQYLTTDGCGCLSWVTPAGNSIQSLNLITNLTGANSTLSPTSLNVINNITPGSSVNLPATVAGTRFTVVNNSTSSLTVVPPVNSSINQLTANSSISVSATTALDFIAISNNQWFTK